MSNIDKRGLREAAEKATKGRWAVEFDDEIYSTDGVNHEQIAMVFSENEARDAAFIAAANPATVLALLDELETAEKRNDELETYSKTTLEFREAALSENRHLKLELEIAEKRIAELEARAFNPAILDVIAERQRQQSVEGWTPEHDNAYQNSELADAAACYAIHAHNQGFSTPAHWPWSPDWWKQSGARRDLVKAGALILAEIERIDRAAGIGVKGE
ncbi:ead/Ea22-like family protein [Escherichia coli]|uniref:ead/Ea22-like family protein n=1 Tax=Escherichia coli TaxID=562 RepID=UPI000FA4ADE2|nr:ead/Ea22-like family protein [Escherichia coli]EGQ6361117.1 ead/Ea22-like family protein [Escherichia coli]MDL4641847.1 ead/Ea22-like family protein [Escherichia coli]MEC5667202.1 ead/Ea22-like family protein [Escherichia coli]MEC5706963.1 ead/Ea22-like family protein [Escherichia coli]MEC6041694.1 ead/Ea22-like family protein [Escherichia coli]